MKRMLLVLAGSAALAVGVAAPAAAQDGPGTIVDVAASDPQFSTLVDLVTKAGLVETLSGGEFTVFAPTNAAFRKVPKRTLAALARDPEKLKAVLTYHVVAGTVRAADIVKARSVRTVNGKSVKVCVRGRNVFLNNSAKVTATDIEASNGVVHVINRVLIP